MIAREEKESNLNYSNYLDYVRKDTKLYNFRIENDSQGNQAAVLAFYPAFQYEEISDNEFISFSRSFLFRSFATLFCSFFSNCL